MDGVDGCDREREGEGAIDLVGPSFSKSALALTPLAVNQRIPLISGETLFAGLGKKNYFLRTAASNQELMLTSPC